MLDVLKSRELQAAILALKQANREVRRDIGREARRELKPVWNEALLGNTITRLEVRVLVPGAAVKVGTRQVTLVAGSSRRALAGGLVPNEHAHAVEWGARPRQKAVQLTSRRGKKYTARRRQGGQFRPRTPHGYVVSPAAASTGHRIVAGWVRVIVEQFAAAGRVEG